MLSFLRNKTVLSLMMLLALGMAMGVAQNRAVESGRVFLVQDMVSTVLAPLQIASAKVLALGRWAVTVARPRRAILRENAALRKRVRELTRENARLREVEAENASLRAMLRLGGSAAPGMIAGQVISRQASTWFDTLTINRGRRSAVTRGAAVINHLGLVGQVVEADLVSSQVVALTDESSAVGAMVQRSRSSGILQGQGADYPVLTYLPKDAQVRPSDIVVSSGMGGVIPKGFVIGRVVRVMRNSVAGTTSALVRPSVRFDAVEQVFIVKPGQTLTSSTSPSPSFARRGAGVRPPLARGGAGVRPPLARGGAGVRPPLRRGD